MPESDTNMRIAIGCDHAGFETKERLKAWLLMHGYTVDDYGTDSTESIDYTDYAQKVASAVSEDNVPMGLLICGTGLGMSYAANRFKNVRAALCWSVEVAELARIHNDSNILVLPGRTPTMDPLEDILATWLENKFSNDERHIRRISKIDSK